MKVKVARGEGGGVRAHIAKKFYGHSILLLCFLDVSKLVLYRNM